VEATHLDVRAGDRLALVGESGCGKSTLVGLIALALRPEPQGSLAICAAGGTIQSEAIGLWRQKRDDELTALRRRLFGYVQQTGALLPFLSVRRNMELPQTICGLHDPEGLDELAERVGIAHLMARRPDQLSVGQRQRVSIVRALAHRPDIVLADEPTAALDPGNAESVLGLLVEQATARGAALLLATHDRAAAERFGFEIVAADSSTPGRTVFSQRLAEEAQDGCDSSQDGVGAARSGHASGEGSTQSERRAHV